IADVHNTGVFSRTLDDKFSARGQTFEVNLARFVGAVLTPHHGKNAKFRDIRIAPENFLDARVLFRGDAVFRSDFRSDFDFRCGSCHYAVAFAVPTRASTMDLKMTRPSEESSADSMARSGCGIRPATLRSRLQMPAMLCIEPLGLPAASLQPSGVA